LAPTFDLQAHSVYSDGALAPEEVVRRAHDAGVEVFALTDHDTVEGVDEALETASSLGLRMTPAVEISSVDGEYQDLHVLAYGLDHRSPELGEQLARFREDRELRAERMADRLRELGYALDGDQLAARSASGKPIGRPHLAQAVVSEPANAERLAREGLDEVTPFLVAYLIDGKPAFVGRTTPTVGEAIGLIHAHGGVAVWAHPFWDVEDPDEVLGMLDRYAGLGLDGVEAFYKTHDREQATLLAEAAAERGMLTTGSSDFHGPEHRLFRSFRDFDTFGHDPRLPKV
jgi:predicted metal-dependent phosphoesterase TrpH